MAGHPSVKKRQKELARKERRDEKAVKRDQRRADRNNPSERALDEFGNPVEHVEAETGEMGETPPDAIEGVAPAAPVDP